MEDTQIEKGKEGERERKNKKKDRKKVQLSQERDANLHEFNRRKPETNKKIKKI